MREAVPERIPVTVKMRRGLDDSQQSRDNFFTIFDGVLPAAWRRLPFMVEPSTAYIGPSRWAFLAEVRRHAGSRTILGSGDLFTAHDCLAMMRETGVNGVTAAQARSAILGYFRRLER